MIGNMQECSPCSVSVFTAAGKMQKLQRQRLCESLQCGHLNLNTRCFGPKAVVAADGMNLYGRAGQAGQGRAGPNAVCAALHSSIKQLLPSVFNRSQINKAVMQVKMLVPAMKSIAEQDSKDRERAFSGKALPRGRDKP